MEAQKGQIEAKRGHLGPFRRSRFSAMVQRGKTGHFLGAPKGPKSGQMGSFEGCPKVPKKGPKQGQINRGKVGIKVP